MKRWAIHNGYRDVLAISLPLVISMASVTIMQFTDQVFLANYSLNAIAAAMPAGIAAFVFLAFFIGTAGYVNVFIAQYTGSGTRRKVGSSLWQGFYFAVASGLVLIAISYLGETIFELADHSPEVRELEVVYFRIVTAGGGVRLLGIVLSCFYSGRGLTKPVMIVNTIAAGVNIPLDYAMINGLWGFPEMGIQGAAIATVVASGVAAVLFAVLLLLPKNNREFGIWAGRRFNRELFGRLMRYGLPGGVQFFLDIAAFSFFFLLIGRLGKEALAASNIVIAINHLAFMPIVGFSIGISTMVGQAIGAGKPDEAVIATSSTNHITLAYMISLALVFVLAPEWLMSHFQPREMGLAEFNAITATGVILLRFVAVYTLCDGVAIIYSGALKGAGDTRFVMWLIGLLSATVLVGPVYVGIEFLGMGLYTAWMFLTGYLLIMTLCLWYRFKRGKWRSMRVIESAEELAAEAGPTP